MLDTTKVNRVLVTGRICLLMSCGLAECFEHKMNTSLIMFCCHDKVPSLDWFSLKFLIEPTRFGELSAVKKRIWRISMQRLRERFFKFSRILTHQHSAYIIDAPDRKLCRIQNLCLSKTFSECVLAFGFSKILKYTTGQIPCQNFSVQRCQVYKTNKFQAGFVKLILAWMSNKLISLLIHKGASKLLPKNSAKICEDVFSCGVVHMVYEICDGVLVCHHSLSTKSKYSHPIQTGR